MLVLAWLVERTLHVWYLYPPLVTCYSLLEALSESECSAMTIENWSKNMQLFSR